MRSAPSCSACANPLPVTHLNISELLPCPNCGAETRGELFPAFFREAKLGSSGQALTVDSEASCFYHSRKRAEVVCGACGRYLCGLCDVELEGSHFCPDCLHKSQEKGKLASIDNSRKAMDDIAFHLALFGGLIFYFSPFTAPFAIYLSFKHWKSPLSIVRRSRWRFVAATILGIVQILGWLALIAYFLLR